jgi:glycosyltransferase involved in cell wall biosynthesis
MLRPGSVLRVTLLIPTLGRSGAEKQMTLLACGLPRDRFDVKVIALTRGGPFEDDLKKAGVPVDVIGKKWRLDFSSLSQLKQRLLADPPDILHTWMFAANSYGRLVSPKDRRWKIIVSERCVDSWKSRWQLWIDRWLVSKTDWLLGNSASVVEFYKQQGLPTDRMSVIPNAVSAPPQPAVSKADFLKQLSFPPETKLIGYVGRLAKQKKIETILWGMQVLRQADASTRLIIVGDGPERAALEQHARDIEVADFVRFLGHREDASQLLHHLDAFWLASSFEGMSNSLMEAMASGVPAIASDIPPNRELIRHGEHGYLVNIGDGVGYAQYSMQLFREPDLRTRLANAGRMRMETEFSLERMIQTHVDLYERLTR